MRRAARNSVSPYREGYIARHEGKSPNDCPYRSMVDHIMPDVERAGWMAGYYAADQQLAREGKKDA